jgi:hypothetical protein
VLIFIDISHSDHQKFIILFSVKFTSRGPVPGRGPAVEKHGSTQQQDRQRTYKRYREARWRDHCCCGKAIIISYSECMPAALAIKQATRMRRMPSVACLTLQ